MNFNDIAHGKDVAAVSAVYAAKETATWSVQWTCFKWSEEACEYVRKRLRLDKDTGVGYWLLRKYATIPDLGTVVFEPDVSTVLGNILVNVGINRLEDLLIGAGGQAYNNGNSRIGAGDSATAATAADTDLNAIAGSTHRQFVVMDATFPSRASQTVTWQASHTSGLSNFAWQEWGIDNGTANSTTVVAPLLNHKVESLGTKVTGTWVIQGAITIA